MTLVDVPASAVNPRTNPDWQFAVYIPGRCRAKGSQEKEYWRRGNKTVINLVERPNVQQWVAICAAYAIQERRRLEAQGDRSFPYEERLKLWSLFVYDRPKSSSTPSPTPAKVYGDIEKLVRSVADALCPGEFYWKQPTGKMIKVAKAAVIADDSLITRLGEPAKVFRDETVQNLPAGAYLLLTRAPDNKIDGSLYTYRREPV